MGSGAHLIRKPCIQQGEHELCTVLYTGVALNKVLSLSILAMATLHIVVTSASCLVLFPGGLWVELAGWCGATERDEDRQGRDELDCFLGDLIAQVLDDS